MLICVSGLNYDCHDGRSFRSSHPFRDHARCQYLRLNPRATETHFESLVLSVSDVWRYWSRPFEDQTHAERGKESKTLGRSMGQSEYPCRIVPAHRGNMLTST